MLIGFGLSLMAGLKSSASPAALFAGGEVGVWYDPSDLTTLFQDSAGTTPVTAAGQTVGKILDKSGRGNHATQATSAQRPTYGFHPITGLRNVANGSAAYSNATYWPASSVNSGITVTRTAGSDATGAYIDVRYAGTATGGGTDVTFQYAPSRRAASIGDVYTCSAVVQRVSGVATNSSMSVGVSQEIAPSTYSGGTDSAVTTSATPVTISATHTVTVGNQVRPSVNFGFTIGATIDVTYRIRELQFEKSATRTAYQANYSQYNVTEAGVASAYYLSFDGVDDGMVTNTITPNTDKVQMFFGRRKLRETTREMLVEFATGGGVNGAASIDQVNNAGTITYSFTSRGTIGQGASVSGITAPVTNVFTALGDISGATAELRVNGAFGNINVGSQGTGNYLAYPLYIGCRGGSLLFSNINIYSLIVRFGPNLTAGQITSTETWVNGKTGAY